jgi:hypothetical protein
MSSQPIISFRPETVIRQLPWRLGSKTALGFILILAIFSLVGWLYLTNASTVTATSYRIDELRLELDQLRNQNATLILEIAQLEALSRVEARARELDFEATTNVKYISVAQYPRPSELEMGRQDELYQVENSVEGYRVDLEEPGWWVETLDTIAVWLEDRDEEAVEYPE